MKIDEIIELYYKEKSREAVDQALAIRDQEWNDALFPPNEWGHASHKPMTAASILNMCLCSECKDRIKKETEG